MAGIFFNIFAKSLSCFFLAAPSGHYSLRPRRGTKRRPSASAEPDLTGRRSLPPAQPGQCHRSHHRFQFRHSHGRHPATPGIGPKPCHHQPSRHHHQHYQWRWHSQDKHLIMEQRLNILSILIFLHVAFRGENRFTTDVRCC
ncbi:hypothetical protein TNCT_135731 [Trichonephila clavata]|uniref:Secreted protein n=1 Tax=Trichonephila clavata TaxID=2740835 RepID=A0A8X6LWJ1_TRICU|nr:hypothetical protein TNCT_135731 [Trichonephila clavata]